MQPFDNPNKKTLVNELSVHINHIKMHWEITEISVRKNVKVVFAPTFFEH